MTRVPCSSSWFQRAVTRRAQRGPVVGLLVLIVVGLSLSGCGGVAQSATTHGTPTAQPRKSQPHVQRNHARRNPREQPRRAPRRVAVVAPKQQITTCSTWLSATAKAQSKLTLALSGHADLALLVEGTTGACINWANGGNGGIAIATAIVRGGSGWPYRVHINEAKLPPTLDPSDPHQCYERLDAIANPTNARMPIDCLVMGF
jgi:hypothetical protein